MAGEVRTLKFADGVTVAKPDDITSGGGSGTGEINYITNPDLEIDASDWSAYKDADQDTPVDGTGGFPSSSVSLNTGSLIRGTNSLRFTKPGSDLRGEGFSTDFVIENPDRNKLLKISFDYNVGAGYASDDMKLFIVDTTTGSVITPDNNCIKDFGSSVVASHIATFSTTANTGYRLIFHIASESAVSYTMDVDNVVVGPGSVAKGAIVGPWESYTPASSGGWGTLGNVNLEYSRSGESMFIRGFFDTGTVAATEIQLALPDSLTVGGNATGDTAVAGQIYPDAARDDSFIALATSGDAYLNVCFSIQTGMSPNPMVPLNGNDGFNSTERVSVDIGPIPIAEWAGSGVVNLASEDNLNSWQSDTLTVSNTTVTGDETYWRRVGDSLEWRGGFDVDTPAGGSPVIMVDIPNGYTADTSKMHSAESTTKNTIGNGSWFESATTQRSHLAAAVETTGDKIRFYVTDGTTKATLDASEITNGDQLSWHVTIPIVEFAGSQNSLIGFAEADDHKLGLVKGNKEVLDPSSQTNWTGGDATIARYGDIAVLTFNNIAHASSTGTPSDAGFIPVEYRPTNYNTFNTYLQTSAGVRRIGIQSDGTVTFSYTDWAGVGFSDTSTNRGSATWIIGQ